MPVASPFRPDRSLAARRGFALILALGLMSLLVLLLLTLATLTRVETRAAETAQYYQTARHNARFALQLALAELQKAAGPDQRATATAEIVDPHLPNPKWTGVWDAANPGREPVWLVSSKPHRRAEPQSTEADDIVLLGAASAPLIVKAPRVPLLDPDTSWPGPPREVGAFAWWIGDEGVKASLTALDRSEEAGWADAASLQTARQLSPPSPNLKVVWPEIDPGDPKTREAFDKKVRHRGHLTYLKGLDSEAVRGAYFDTTLLSRGVLSNSLEGGLRINLARPDDTDPFLGGALGKFLGMVGTTAPFNAVFPPDVLAAPPVPQTPIVSFVPIVTECKLSIGIFHTRSDSYHRIRFHLETEFWNPYPLRMQFREERAFLAVVQGLPIVKVANQSNGAVIECDLNDFPPCAGLSNGMDNPPKERQINSWIQIDGRHFEPGEIYRSQEPWDSKPEGLARSLSEEQWSWTGTGPGGGQTTGPSLSANDNISISTRGTQSVTFVFAEYKNGGLGNDTTPDDYLTEHGAFLVIKNIPFEDFSFILPGEQYSRDTSGDYDRDAYTMAYYFRLNNDKDSPATILNHLDPRSPVIDFSDPVIASCYTIIPNPREAKAEDNIFSDLDYPLFDVEINSHQSSLPDGLRLFDLPTSIPLHPGSLQHLQVADRPAYAIGSPDGKAGLANAVYDRYFSTGQDQPLEASNQDQGQDDKDDKDAVLKNARLQPWSGYSADLEAADSMTGRRPAALLALHGAFNVNSLSMAAWESILSSTIEPWKSTTLVNPFFRLAWSAGQSRNFLADSELPDGIPSEGEVANVLFQQGVRSLDEPGQLGRLAQGIVQRLKARSRPFLSLKELADSGLLAETINDPAIMLNPAGLSPLAPTYLRQADFMAALAPVATTRSDTFIIRTCGEAINPATGRREGRAWLEATVQRLPDYIDSTDTPEVLPVDLSQPINQLLGRRFIVRSLHWLNPDEV